MSAVADETPQPEPQEPARPEWVWMVNRAIAEVDGERPPVRFPNDDVVIEHQQARGWELTDEPQEQAFTAPTGVAADDEAERDPWVTLVHPDIEGGTNRVPNDPAALQGAFDAGWHLPEDQPERKPAKRTAKKQASTEPADDDKE